MNNPLEKSIPESLQNLIADARWVIVTEGESNAQVFRLSVTDRYLKISEKNTRYPVLDEKKRLDWLAGRVPVPEVLHYAENETHQFLLTSALDSLHPMHDKLNWSPQDRIRVLADAARKFHSLPVSECPFSWRIPEQIEAARKYINSTKIKTHLLEKQWQHHTPQSLFEIVLALKPQNEDLVVAHGDLYPVNMRVSSAEKTILGYIDVGRMGIADRYTDLALIANAIRWHYGAGWIPYFFRAYGIDTINTQKLHFYQLINEFIQDG